MEGKRFWLQRNQSWSDQPKFHPAFHQLSVMKLVSIAIVNWNGAKFIVRCIRSIFEQAHKAVEVIVVDNASTDGSAELVEKEFGDKVRVVRNENVGYAGGANLAISLAKGDFIIIANSDIVFGDTYIDRCIEALEADPKAGAVSGKLLRYDFDADSIVPVIDSAGIAMNCLRETNDIGQNEPDKGQYEFDMQVFGVCGVAAVFKREVLEAVRLSTGEYYDPDFFTYKEDVDMSWRLNLYGPRPTRRATRRSWAFRTTARCDALPHPLP